jgi:hypothetical protein
MDGNIEKMQSLTGRIKGLGIDKTLTKKGMCAEAEATGKALATKVSITDIVDDLLSVASDKPLSANQGRLLKKLIDEIDPHYAENVIYNDTNVKDALDKVSKAENIDYDGEKSVRGAIDELKGTIGCTEDNLIINVNILSEQTMNNVTCTPNGDGTFTLNGTATARAFFNINYNQDRAFKSGDYVVSGGNDKAFVQVVSSNESIAISEGADVEFTTTNSADNWVRILINEGTVLDNVTVHPYVRYNFKKDLQSQLNNEKGIVKTWEPKGTNLYPHRNYYIKRSNSITIYFMTTPGALTENAVGLVICEDVCKTFGITNFRDCFTVGFALIGNAGQCVPIGISAKSNTLNVERMNVNTQSNSSCYGQITIVTA